MKMLLTLAASSLFLSGCAIGKFPAFPEDITSHYMVEVRDEEIPEEALLIILDKDTIPAMAVHEVVRCLKFDIVSKIPYKIKFNSQVETKECSLVGGFKPAQAQSLYNWFDDVVAWAEDRKKCFK